MLRVYIYRPDKSIYQNENIKNEDLYGPDGKNIQEKKKIIKHPLDNITRIKIKSSFVEVER